MGDIAIMLQRLVHGWAMGTVLRMGSPTPIPWQYSSTTQTSGFGPHPPHPHFWSQAGLVFRMHAQLCESEASAATLLAGKALLEQEVGRLNAANARLEGERATQQAALTRADQEREAWRRDKAQLEREKVALQTALGVQEEAGRQDRAQLEAQLHVARRELRDLEERMARVRAAMEL